MTCNIIIIQNAAEIDSISQLRGNVVLQYDDSIIETIQYQSTVPFLQERTLKQICYFSKSDNKIIYSFSIYFNTISFLNIFTNTYIFKFAKSLKQILMKTVLNASCQSLHELYCRAIFCRVAVLGCTTVYSHFIFHKLSLHPSGSVMEVL